MTEVYDIVRIQDLGDVKQFRIRYQRTLTDVNDASVTIFAGTEVKTETQLEAELSVWNSRKTNAEAQIAKITNLLSEVDIVKDDEPVIVVTSK